MIQWVPKYTINRIKRVKLSNNNWEILWKKLLDYIERLNEQQKIADIVENNNVIQLIYVEMPYAKTFCSSAAFLNLVFLDGTFCSDNQKSTIISSVTVTSDKVILPIAVAMTSGENKENYNYFIKKLTEVLTDSDQLFFISDQNPSIQPCIKSIFPLSHFIPCAWHVSKHIHCPSIIFFELIKSDHPVLFNIRLEYFKKIICGDIENYEVKKHIVKTFIKQIILYNDAIVIFYNFTDLNYTQSAITNIIDNFDLEKEKQKLLTEQEINKNIDLSIFYSKEYFAVLQKREQ